MLLANLAFAAAAALAGSTGAADGDLRFGHTIGTALKAGCHVQQVHTPAGKPVQSAPIIRCDRQPRMAPVAQATTNADAKSRRSSD